MELRAHAIRTILETTMSDQLSDLYAAFLDGSYDVRIVWF
jgi:hypothetical protein